jgi:putative flippase GtrA
MVVNRPQLVLCYVAFAMIATACNLGAQRVILRLDPSGFGYYPALLAGTLVGLTIKYGLDKRWIFADRACTLAAHRRKLSLYMLMGVVTTAVFWGTETLFWLAGGTQTARETGALLGLSIGYLGKYHLDRRYVFTDAARLVGPV